MFGRRHDHERVHYKMRQKLVAFGDDFWIEDDSGRKVFKIDGKVLRLRDTLIFEDARGHELAKIREKVARVRDTMEIEAADGRHMATVRKAVITPLRDRWSISVDGGPDLEVKGNVVDHEYSVNDGRTEVAAVSKKWFRVADTYGVEMEPDEDPILVLATVAAIDLMTHD